MPGYLGAAAGSVGGKALAKELGAGDVVSDIVGGIGGLVGGFFSPVATGGGVKKDTKVILHKGEYVLPRGVKPTMAQRKAVAKNKAVGFRKQPARKVPAKRKPRVRKTNAKLIKKKKKN